MSKTRMFRWFITLLSACISLFACAITGALWWGSQSSAELRVFDAYEGYWRDIYVQDALTGLRLPLTIDGQNNHNPLVSPDGQHIIYFSDRVEADLTRERVFIMERNGRNPQPLLAGLSQVGAISRLLWSPDGTQIALNLFESQTRRHQLYRLDLATQTLTRLTNSLNLWRETPFIWADNGLILYYLELSLGEIYVYRAEQGYKPLWIRREQARAGFTPDIGPNGVIVWPDGKH